MREEYSTLITATGISKSYGGKKVLSGVDFSASPGESAVIVGRNGSGKSTLLSILAGYLKPDAGTVTIQGANAAFCPQSDNLFEDLTVRDNILFWRRAKGSHSNPNSPDLIKLFDVGKYEGKRVRQLSGGMKKSVAIICALTNDSSVLILDEPFSGLDIFYKNSVLLALDRLKSMGKCVVYTSHNSDEITGLDSQIYTLSQGKLSCLGSRDSVVRSAPGGSLLEAILNNIQD